MTISGATYREGVAYSPDGAMYVTPTGTANITGGTITGITDLAVADGGTGASTAQAAAANLGVPFVLAKWGIPFIVATSGTMGNNGAISAMTALGNTYSGGAWLYLPAGAVAAGVPAAAAWLWFVASSTTAGTVYNSTYTTGTPTLGVTTAFSTTGPGAFTGVTTQISGPTITIPANSMGAFGRLSGIACYSRSGAGTNTMGMVWGGTEFGGNAQVGDTHYQTDIRNCGATNVNVGSSWGVLAAAALHGAQHYAAIDCTASQTFIYKPTRGTATDNMVLESAEIQVVF